MMNIFNMKNRYQEMLCLGSWCFLYENRCQEMSCLSSWRFPYEKRILGNATVEVLTFSAWKTNIQLRTWHFPYEKWMPRNVMFELLTFSVWKMDLGKCHGRGVDIFRMKNEYPVAYLTFSIWKTDVFEFWKMSCFSIPYVYRMKRARIRRIPHIIRWIWHDFCMTCFHKNLVIALEVVGATGTCIYRVGKCSKVGRVPSGKHVHQRHGQWFCLSRE